MKKIISIVLTLAIVLCLFAGCSSQPSSSDNKDNADEAWTPSQPITLIVLAGAGGGADVSCRLLASYAEEYLGQNIVIQNVAGGGGSIALQQLTSSAPDGYTIAYISPGKSNNDILLDGVTTTVDDYTPIAKFSSDPNIIITANKFGINDFNSFVDAVKEKPGEFTFGLAGAWGNGEFMRIQLENNFDLEFKRMVFDSGTLAANSVAAGDCAVSGPFFTEGIAQIDAGNVVPLAVTSSERLSILPDVPTIAEITGTDFSWYVWRGLVGPAGMDEKVVSALSDAFEQACNDEEYQAKALELGIFTDFQNYEDFSEFFISDHEVYRDMIENNSF